MITKKIYLRLILAPAQPGPACFDDHQSELSTTVCPKFVVCHTNIFRTSADQCIPGHFVQASAVAMRQKEPAISCHNHYSQSVVVHSLHYWCKVPNPQSASACKLD